MIILGYFFLFLHKHICCGYSLEAPRRVASNEYPQHMFFMKNWRKLSQNYHQILLLIKSPGAIFLFYHEKVYCVYSLALPHQGNCNEYTQHTIILKKTEKTALIYTHSLPDLAL